MMLKILAVMSSNCSRIDSRIKAEKVSMIYLYIISMFIHVNKRVTNYLRDVGKHTGVGLYEIRGIDTFNRQAFGKGNSAQLSSQVPPQEGHQLLAFTGR